MESKTFYNESLTEHNVHPYHKHTLEGANMALEGVNPSCGDDIVLLLKVEDDKIVDGAFQGDGCAVSQASADMMLDLIIGKSKDEALRLADIFLQHDSGQGFGGGNGRAGGILDPGGCGAYACACKMCLSRMAYCKGNARKRPWLQMRGMS